MSRQGRALRAGAALLALSAAAVVGAQCVPGISCGFSVNGKKGPFLDNEVTPETLARADTETSAGLSDGRSLDSVSLNKGALAGTGIRMPQAEARLQEMLARIRAGWPAQLRTPPPITVRILGSTSYGPVAHPDNVITVPLGLLINAKYDDEVMWVLAHEFAHIALAHFSREAKQRRLKSNVEKAVDCTRVGLALAQTRFSTSGNQITATHVEDKSLQAASLQVWAKSAILNDFLEAYNQHLSRRQEDQADVVGYDLAYRAKYSQDGFDTALKYLKIEEERNGTWLKQFGTDLGGYMQRAGGQAGAQVLSGGKVNDVLGGLLNGFTRNAKSLLLKRLGDMVFASHRPAGKRLTGMHAYVDRAYPNGDNPDAVSAWLTSVRAGSDYRDAKIAVDAVDKARHDIPVTPCADADEACKLAVATGLRKALDDLAPALRTIYSGTPLVLNTAAYLEAQNHNLQGADQLYVRAENVGVAAPPTRVSPARVRGKAKPAPVVVAPTPPVSDAYLEQSLDGFADHVDLLLKMKNYTKASAVIALAKTRFHDDDRFLPALITIAVQTRNNPALLDAIRRCGATEDVALRDSCNVAFLGPDQRDVFDKMAPADQDKVLNAFDLASADVRKGSTCGLPIVQPGKPRDDDDDKSG